jgi:hypothetical protein
MDNLARKTVHQLAHRYRLASKSHNHVDGRYTVLTKRYDTCLPDKMHQINNIIKRYETNTTATTTATFCLNRTH